MRYISLKLFVLFFLCMLFACSKEEDDSFELSTNEVTLNKSANYGSFMVIASGSWSIEIPSNGQWCTVSPKQGQGRMEVKIKGEAYSELASRETTLNVISGNTSRSVRVVQPGADLTVTQEPIVFAATGGSKVTKIQTTKPTTAWEISIPSTETDITVSPRSGKGPKDITITLGANPTSHKREVALTINCNGKSASIPLEQAAGGNHDPNDFQLTAPVKNETGTARVTTFKWQAAIDPDGDPVSYRVEYSTDRSTWIKLPETNQIQCSVETPLNASTQYYWRVIALDDQGGSKTSMEQTFTTGNTAINPDGYTYEYKGQYGDLTGTIPVVFIGDGFVEADYEAGGYFDQRVKEGIDHFFATDPYKKYRNLFKAHIVVAHSSESGASRWDEKGNKYIIKKNTAFDTRYYGDGYTSTKMTTDCPKVYQYAQKISSITDAALRKTTVVLIVNDRTYSGTCWMETDGRSVSIVPTCETPYSYKETMAHEAGGHGFGRLADEYVYDNGYATADAIKDIINWSNWGANSNIDVTDDRSKVKWKHFFNQTGYSAVTCVSGAQYAAGGVWMPENSSVMRNMKDLYYNAPSREAIIKRIQENRGITYKFSDFIQMDKGMQRTSTYKMSARSGYVSKPTAHTPPQRYIPTKR